MCRVIRVSDLLGAAGEYAGGYISHENWDGGSLGLSDLYNDGPVEEAEADGMAVEDDEFIRVGRTVMPVRIVGAVPAVHTASRLLRGGCCKLQTSKGAY